MRRRDVPVTISSPADAARFALFQHMIANHDWSMRAGPEGDDCCHNAELIGPLAPGATAARFPTISIFRAWLMRLVRDPARWLHHQQRSAAPVPRLLQP